MKLLVFIIFVNIVLSCSSQEGSISLDDLKKSLSTEINCDLNSTQIKQQIKLINTFFYYKRVLDSQTQELLQTSVNDFEDDCWKQIKTEYEFKLSTGGAYYSSKLDINFGGSFARDEDFYQILEHSEYMQSRKDIYSNEIKD